MMMMMSAWLYNRGQACTSNRYVHAHPPGNRNGTHVERTNYCPNAVLLLFLNPRKNSEIENAGKTILLRAVVQHKAVM